MESLAAGNLWKMVKKMPWVVPPNAWRNTYLSLVEKCSRVLVSSHLIPPHMGWAVSCRAFTGTYGKKLWVWECWVQRGYRWSLKPTKQGFLNWSSLIHSWVSIVYQPLDTIFEILHSWAYVYFSGEGIQDFISFSKWLSGQNG